MPVVRSLPGQPSQATSDDQEEARKQLLQKIHDDRARSQKASEAIDSSSDDEVEEEEAVKLASVNRYRSLAERTKDLALEKLILSAEGCALFDQLCLRIDVNQRYADFLPQWKDVANVLEVDDLRTRWIETCVRPKEGLSRAMLEIYMRDGGTLGEVLEALLKLECLDILETLSDQVEKYIRDRTWDVDDEDHVGDQKLCPVNEKFFSVLQTLLSSLGKNDPCQDIHRYAGGLKRYCSTTSAPIEHSIMVQNGGIEIQNYAASIDYNKLDGLYKSELHFNPKDDFDFKKTKLVLEDRSGQKCKVLLLFSQDGIAASNVATSIADSIQQDDCSVELFRLNEATLWYEVLTNPEACCMKWSDQADYIMPILTPAFLKDIHGNNTGGGDNENNDLGLLPTSPILNRYMYNLARSQYTAAGCKNYKVRPIIPVDVLPAVRQSKAVKIDPLMSHSWIPLTEERLTGRLKGMLHEFAKRTRN